MKHGERTVLLADDEAFMRRLLQATFRKGGYRVVEACSGREALKVAGAEKPDLIVMDILMPDLDGLSAVEQLKRSEATASIPVIVLSAKGHAMTKVEAERAGAALFLTKPFSPSHLLGEASRLLEQS